ncbi:MAG: ABC transporter permease subunit, partial [Gemmataceae bacterium]|nr:ABC transporter permease subunit [Gemmataceae bacterium]
WSIIRLIWWRELRDQLRDRRTLFLIGGLPLLLYPVLGYAVLHFAFSFQQKPSVIGVVGGDERMFPSRGSAAKALEHFAPAACAASGASLDRSLGCLAWVETVQALTAAFRRSSHDKPLIDGNRFVAFESGFLDDATTMSVDTQRFKIIWLTAADPEALASRKVDLILQAAPSFRLALAAEEAGLRSTRPKLTILSRGDDAARLAGQRLWPILEQWKHHLRSARLARREIHADFENPFDIAEPATPWRPDPSHFDLLVRIFPFMLVMWSLAGALYPAVDLCAGEKERGTMETLLITPAGREEIVLGKFLTIWLFSAASAVLNLISMGLTSWQFSRHLPAGTLPAAALVWCVLLSLPLAALFSAVSLAIGAYARSSKEGQYYLMPLFIVTMPLIFLTLAPGVELSPFYSLVPVTGVALLMQRLMTAPSLEQVPWLYFIPVLAPIALYSWLALRWAIDQFQREEVLFREAERIDVGLWLRHLFRDKAPTATAAQAYSCFALLIGCRWLVMDLGTHLPVTTFTTIHLLAFVAAPVLIMSVVLNNDPRGTLALRLPTWRDLGLAAVLAVLLLPPLAGAAVTVFSRFPHLTQLLEDRQPFMQSLRLLLESEPFGRGDLVRYVVAFALVPALCEELAFRGFLLTGLLNRYRPRTAILLCSFLFALFQMNVFHFVPAFFLGVVLGLLTVRSRSLLPAMLFHLLHNAALLATVPLKAHLDPALLHEIGPYVVVFSLTVAFSLLWWLYRRPYVTAKQAARHPENL